MITLMAHSIVGVVGIAIQSVTGGFIGCFFGYVSFCLCGDRRERRREERGEEREEEGEILFDLGYLAYLAAPNLAVKLVYLFIFCLVLGLWDPYLRRGILVKWAIVDFFVISLSLSPPNPLLALPSSHFPPRTPLLPLPSSLSLLLHLIDPALMLNRYCLHRSLSRRILSFMVRWCYTWWPIGSPSSSPSSPPSSSGPLSVVSNSFMRYCPSSLASLPFSPLNLLLLWLIIYSSSNWASACATKFSSWSVIELTARFWSKAGNLQIVTWQLSSRLSYTFTDFLIRTSRSWSGCILSFMNHIYKYIKNKHIKIYI